MSPRVLGACAVAHGYLSSGIDDYIQVCKFAESRSPNNNFLSILIYQQSKMRLPFRASREDRYRAHVARLTDSEVARAYVDWSAKAATLSLLVDEFARAFDRNDSRSFQYLPNYREANDVDDFMSDEQEAQKLLRKVTIWVNILTEAILARQIETDDLTINQPRRPPFTGRRLDFSAYASRP